MSSFLYAPKTPSNRYESGFYEPWPPIFALFILICRVWEERRHRYGVPDLCHDILGWARLSFSCTTCTIHQFLFSTCFLEIRMAIPAIPRLFSPVRCRNLNTRNSKFPSRSFKQVQQVLPNISSASLRANHAGSTGKYKLSSDVESRYLKICTPCFLFEFSYCSIEPRPQSCSLKT
jgi:hypothetical protein